MGELFRKVYGSVWSEFNSALPVTSLRRELQRDHLNQLINLALGQSPGAPNDARDLAVSQLKSLKARLVTVIPLAKGEYSAPHYAECLEKVNRALSAQTVLPVGP